MANSSFYKNSKLYELDLSGLLFLVNWPDTHVHAFWWISLTLLRFLVEFPGTLTVSGELTWYSHTVGGLTWHSHGFWWMTWYSHTVGGLTWHSRGFWWIDLALSRFLVDWPGTLTLSGWSLFYVFWIVQKRMFDISVMKGFLKTLT